ncbi:hypothetical protein FOCC_FOCC002795, partial [Frankliniella occidentalis]
AAAPALLSTPQCPPGSHSKDGGEPHAHRPLHLGVRLPLLQVLPGRAAAGHPGHAGPSGRAPRSRRPPGGRGQGRGRQHGRGPAAALGQGLGQEVPRRDGVQRGRGRLQGPGALHQKLIAEIGATDAVPARRHSAGPCVTVEAHQRRPRPRPAAHHSGSPADGATAGREREDLSGAGTRSLLFVPVRTSL